MRLLAAIIIIVHISIPTLADQLWYKDGTTESGLRVLDIRVTERSTRFKIKREGKFEWRSDVLRCTIEDDFTPPAEKPQEQESPIPIYEPEPKTEKQRIDRLIIEEKLRKEKEYALESENTYDDIIANFIANRRLIAGMRKEEVLDSWGRPRRINRIHGTKGITEQWVYGKMGEPSFAYFSNGTLTSFSEYDYIINHPPHEFIVRNVEITAGSVHSAYNHVGRVGAKFLGKSPDTQIYGQITNLSEASYRRVDYRVTVYDRSRNELGFEILTLENLEESQVRDFRITIPAPNNKVRYYEVTLKEARR